MTGSKKFEVGDKIFAKVKGFVYWPARVNPLPSDVKIPPNKIPIFFYGTHEVYFISPSSCWVYDEKTKNKWGKPKTRAHFNEGMDEIENNPTIYQYGKDEAAEEFLCQFYEFIKSNGELNKLSVEVIEEDTSRSRYKSGTSDNTSTSKDKSEKPKKSENLKRKQVEKDDDDISGSETPSVDSDNPQDEDFKPAAKKAKAPLPKPSKPKTPRTVKPKTPKSEAKPKKPMKTSAPRKSVNKAAPKVSIKEDKSDLESLSSMSSIEDWKAKDEKDKKNMEEQIKKKQIEQVKKEEEAVKVVKKMTRDRKKSSDNKEESDKSDRDHFNKSENDESDVPKSEPVNSQEKSITQIEKEIVVQISNNDIMMANEKSNSNSKQENEKTEIVGSIEEIPDVKEDLENHLDKKVDPEVKKEEINQSNDKINDKTEQIIKIEDIKPDNNEKEDNLIIETTKDNKVEKPENVEVKNEDDSKETKYPAEKKKDSETLKLDQKGPKELEKTPKKSLLLISDSDDSIVEIEPIKKVAPKKPTKPSESKKNSQKRKIIDLSDSDNEEVTKPQKRSKKISEIKIPKANGKGDRTSKEKSPLITQKLSPVEILNNYNSDIRTSLRLNHEDYDKCLTTFNSLLEMNLDILNLAKTPLTETIKKCRKYKRNKKIMIGAQKVFEKISKLYANSDPLKVKQVKAIIDEQRNQKSQKDEKSEDAVPSSLVDSEHITESSNIKTVENIATDSSDNQKFEDFDEPKLSIDESNPDIKNEEAPKVDEQPKEIDDSEKLKLLNDELEAKANSILFKIEKNAPVNLKTLSHLLPQAENSQISLPTQWQTTKKLSKKDDKDSDEDEEDDEEIFRRIEQVPIKQNENDEVENVIPKITPKKASPPHHQPPHFNSASKSSINSTLDARIASMINDSMGTNGSSRSSKKSSVSTNNRPSKNSDKSKVDTSAIPLSPKSSGNRLSLEPTYKKVPSLNSSNTNKKEDDSEIYDLLGV